MTFGLVPKIHPKVRPGSRGLFHPQTLQKQNVNNPLRRPIYITPNPPNGAPQGTYLHLFSAPTIFHLRTLSP